MVSWGLWGQLDGLTEAVADDDPIRRDLVARKRLVQEVEAEEQADDRQGRYDQPTLCLPELPGRRQDSRWRGLRRTLTYDCRVHLMSPSGSPLTSDAV